MIEIIKELHQFILRHLTQFGLYIEKQFLGGFVLNLTILRLEAVDKLRDGRHNDDEVVFSSMCSQICQCAALRSAYMMFTKGTLHTPEHTTKPFLCLLLFFGTAQQAEIVWLCWHFHRKFTGGALMRNRDFYLGDAIPAIESASIRSSLGGFDQPLAANLREPQ